MILTCPACSTRYMVDASSLGSEGRRVRCGKCRHTWFQAPAEDLPKQIEEPGRERGEASAVPTGVRFAAKSKKRSGAAGWVLFLVVIAAIAVGAYQFREQIVVAWPPATRLYAALGIPLHKAGEGLDIRNLNIARSENNGTPVLLITGEIANKSQMTRHVPPLRGALVTADKHELQHWVFKTDQTSLKPGEVAAFRTEVANADPAATNVSITFMPEPKPGAGDATP